MKKIIFGMVWVALMTLETERGFATTSGPLRIYFIDVGGGNAFLAVSPSGESMLLDAGTAQSAPHILDVIRKTGVKQIDYMVVTHYHSDHCGGVPYLAQHLRIVNFVDHGPTVEYGRSWAW
jgi:competence protein ComEC